MSEYKNAPQIRFKDFDDAWEQRKLGEIGNTFTGLSGKKKEDFGHGDAKFVTYMNVFSNPISNFKQVESVEIDSKQNEIKYGDIFFTTSSETPEEVGMPSIWLENKRNYYLNSFCFGFRPSLKFDPYFAAYMLRTSNVRNKITLLAQGISRYNISKTQMMNIEVPFPKDSEQIKLGKLFVEIDNLITLHQRKYNNLVNVKKSLLEKMFPKNSSNVPEIRFKGFTDAWEQRKLDRLLEQYTEVTTINNQYPALTSSRKGIFFQTEYFAGNQIASQNNVGYNIVPRNYFTYRHMSDDEIFHFNINNICDFGIVSTLYPVFTTKKELDSKYLQYQLNYGKEFAKFASLQKQGGSRTYMYFAKLKELVLTMPKVEEQTKISSILSNIDNLITLHQRKLEKLNELKKSMLDKMFI